MKNLSQRLYDTLIYVLQHNFLLNLLYMTEKFQKLCGALNLLLQHKFSHIVFISHVPIHIFLGVLWDFFG